MWQKLFEKYAEKNTQYKHFNNPLFYKLLLFWTTIKADLHLANVSRATVR